VLSVFVEFAIIALLVAAKMNCLNGKPASAGVRRIRRNWRTRMYFMFPSR
jgi:hypothetical protein